MNTVVNSAKHENESMVNTLVYRSVCYQLYSRSDSNSVQIVGSISAALSFLVCGLLSRSAAGGRAYSDRGILSLFILCDRHAFFHPGEGTRTAQRIVSEEAAMYSLFDLARDSSVAPTGQW